MTNRKVLKAVFPTILAMLMLVSLFSLALAQTGDDSGDTNQNGEAGQEDGANQDDANQDETDQEGEMDQETGTDQMTDTDQVTGTNQMTDTDQMTDTEQMTDTDQMTDTEQMTDTDQMTGTTQMTGDDQMTDVNQVTGDLSCAQTYTVQSGDSLSTIAQQFYGDPLAYNTIFQATNNAVGTGEFATIDDPNVINAGQVLCIPAQAGTTSATTTGTGTMTEQGTMTGTGTMAPQDSMTINGQTFNFDFGPEEGAVIVENLTGRDLIFDITQPNPDSAWIGPGQMQAFVLQAGQVGYNAHSPAGDFSVSPGQFQVTAGQVVRLACQGDAQCQRVMSQQQQNQQQQQQNQQQQNQQNNNQTDNNDQNNNAGNGDGGNANDDGSQNNTGDGGTDDSGNDDSGNGNDDGGNGDDANDSN